MKQINLKEKIIKGEKIRTKNGKIEEIIGLWSKVPEMKLQGNVYAVYYNYENDHTGEFDFLIGTEEYVAKEQVVLQTGAYLVVSISNATPEKVGQAWQAIWSDEDIYEKRLFTADFEEYLPTGEVTIYLSIK